MPEPQIVVNQLTKTYRVPVREAGLRASMRSLVRRAYEDVAAVQAITFSIEAGRWWASSARMARAKRPR